MKQLYSAGAISSDGGETPPTLRAATSGIPADELQTALSNSSYAAPSGVETPDLPIRLALLNTDAGRLLTHVVPNGGTYFAHTLLHVPETADAQLAILTWGSPLWQKKSPDTPADLPDLPYLPVADVLDDAALREWLTTPTRRDLLEFVMTALLGSNATKRIIVVATAEDVAKIVYAITRTLPQGLLEEFTFSTYESNPLASEAKVIGCAAGGRDLPDECFTEALAFNPETGRKSELVGDVPFASFAVQTLASADYAPLDEVKVQWSKLGLKEARQFDLVYRLTRGTGTLTKEESAAALQHPPLAAWISTRSDALKQFLEWAIDDREFANGSFTRVVQVLRQKQEVIAKLGQVVKEFGVKAIKSGDLGRASNSLEVVLPMVAPAKANAIWGELISLIPDPDQLDWEIRWYLLPRLVRFKQQQGESGVDPGLKKWFEVSTDKLQELLGLDLPRGYQIAACRACLKRDGEPSETLTRTLASRPPLALTLLQPTDSSTDRPVKLFDSLLALAPDHPWFEESINRAEDFPKTLLNRFFESALNADKIDADHAARTHGSRLLELFSGQTGLDRIGTMLLADPPADLLANDSLQDFLDKLRDERGVGEVVKSRIDSVKAVRAYLRSPVFVAETMKGAADGLAVTPPVVPPSTKAEVFEAIAEELKNQSSAPELQANFELTLVHFGSVLANDPADLYENMLRAIRTRVDVTRNANLLQTFLAVALGAATHPELSGKLDGLDIQAFALASEAAKRGGNRLLDEITKRSEPWPKPAKTQWGFLLAAVRPRGFRGFVRDAMIFLAGAAIVGAVWASKILLQW